MATDVTDTLIQRITSQLPADDTFNLIQQAKNDLLTRMNNGIGIAADYDQVFSAVETATATFYAVVKAAAVPGATAASIAAAGAAAGAALTGTVVGATVGIVILVISLIVGLIGALSQPDSGDTQILNDIYQGIVEVRNIVGADHWSTKMDTISENMKDVIGDLNTISSERLAGPDVGGTPSQGNIPGTPPSATKYHNDAQALMAFLGTDQSLWTRPYADHLTFKPGAGGATNVSGWYGNVPTPHHDSDHEGNITVFDPQYTLFAWVYGVQSWLAVHMLAKYIDSTKYDFNEYVTQFIGGPNHPTGLQDWASFLYSQYSTAVLGLVKSDLPALMDINLLEDWLSSAASGFVVPVPDAAPASGVPGPGYAWNGVYGVVDTYGVFPQQPTPIPSSAPSHIIEALNPGIFSGGVDNNGNPVPSPPNPITDNVYAWVKSRLTLGLMARWKALYLLRGYDKVWPFLQKLRIIARQPPDPELTLSDGTKANGDWSLRELCSTLIQTLQGAYWPPAIAGGFTSPVAGQLFPGQHPSVFNVMVVLEQLASGNWNQGPVGVTLNRPLSLRDCISHSAAAL